MSPLRRYLEYIDGYLDSLSGKDEPLRETRDAVKEVLEETRIRTRNLKYVADIRAKSIEAGFQVGQLPSWGVDDEAVLRVQSGLEQSIVNLVAGLRALAELAAPAAGGKKSGPGSARRASRTRRYRGPRSASPPRTMATPADLSGNATAAGPRGPGSGRA